MFSRQVCLLSLSACGVYFTAAIVNKIQRGKHLSSSFIQKGTDCCSRLMEPLNRLEVLSVVVML